MGTTGTTLGITFAAVILVCVTAGVVTCWRMSTQKKQDGRRGFRRRDSEERETAHRRALDGGRPIPMIKINTPTPPPAAPV